jgi:hypothetical protein
MGIIIVRGEDVIAEHIEKNTFTESIVDPNHEERTVTKEFRQAREMIKKDGHFLCYICGTTEHLEEHHYGCEKSEANDCDFDKLKAYLLEHDIYGYSRAMIDIPLVTEDDVRNQMMLCKLHHTGKGTGIHGMTHGYWIMQKLCKDGQNPVIGANDTTENALERVK